MQEVVCAHTSTPSPSLLKFRLEFRQQNATMRKFILGSTASAPPMCLCMSTTQGQLHLKPLSLSIVPARVTQHSAHTILTYLIGR